MPITTIPSPEEIKNWSTRDVANDPIPPGGPALVETVRGLNQSIALLQQGIAKLQRKTPKDLRDALNLLFEKHDFSPAEKLVEMVLETDSMGRYVLTPDQRIRVLSDLQSYVMPKLKSVEVSGEVEHKHSITIIRYGDDGKIKREALDAPKHRDAIDIVTTPRPVAEEVKGE